MDRLSYFKFGKNTARGWQDFERNLNKMVDRLNDLAEIVDGQSVETETEKRREKRTEKTVRPIGGDTVRVANLTGGTLGIYNAVRIEVPTGSDDLLNTYHNGELVLHAKKPQEDDTVFAVTLDIAGENGIASAKISGPVGVMVDVTDTEHEYATVEADETGYLVSAETGHARLLTVPSETGKQFCVVLLGAVAPGDEEQYAIVEEPIGRPEDLEAEPPENMGKIRIIGKTYKDGEYDDCGCLELCETEILWKEQVKVIGPFSYSKNEEGAEGDESSEKKGSYYLAVETKGEYYTKLEEPLTYQGTSTVKITRQEEEQTFTVHDAVLLGGQQYNEGDPVTVGRSGDRLVVIDGNCPSLEEES